MQSAKSDSTGVNYQTTTKQDWENINAAINRGTHNLFSLDPMRMSEWAEENFYLSPESSSVTGAWENIPYQVGIMNCISNDDIRTVTWRKSARTGFTKIVAIAIGYFTEHKKRSGVVWQPTDSDAQDFVKDEIDPMIRDVPVVRNIFPSFEKKSKHNTLDKKVFLGCVLDIRGAASPRNFRRLTKEYAIYDELSAFDDDIGKEGSGTALGDIRLTTAVFPKSVRGSTPKIKGACQITSSLDEADLILKYKVPCPHCNNLQVLKWGGDKASFGMKWDHGSPKTVGYVCEHCKESFDYSCLPKILEGGDWFSDCGVKLGRDGFFYKDNKIIDPPEHVGFDELWAAYSTFLTWPQLISEYLKAVEESKTGVTSKLKTFVNTRLGQEWEEDQGEKLDPNSLYQRREHYVAELPEGVLYLTAGVDTQDDRFEYSVKGWGVGEECWDIDYVRLYGDLSRLDIWNVLADKLRKTYTRFDGIELSIGTICHDSGGHFTDEVYEFSKKHGLNWVIPIKGASQPGKPIATFPRKRNKKGVYLTEVGTDNAKSIIYQRLNILEPGPGYCHWPISDKFDETHFEQLTVEKKILSYSRGKRVFVWVLPSGRRNEPLDCAVYALAALRIAIQHKGIDLLQLSVSRPEDKDKPEERRKSKYWNS
ncbi:MAG: phage terminase large subunit family protein [Desulfobacterales bacterium]|nr:phage terminase large subunit family protein [Desulfobacterales bacterium]